MMAMLVLLLLPLDYHSDLQAVPLALIDHVVKNNLQNKMAFSLFGCRTL
jgi:hypothetical protein